MKLVKTTEYLLFINEEREPFNVGNIGVKYKALKAEDRTLVIANDSNLLSIEEHWRKVIAYYPLTKEAKELDLPLLPNPFKEEIDIEKLACNIYNLSLDEYEYINEDLSQNRSLIEEHYKDINREEIAEKYFDVISFIAGYNAAQSKQFSLEDMKKAFQAGTQSGYQFCDLEHYYREQESQLPNEEIPDEDEEFEEFIQSLSTQQLPKGFEVEEKSFKNIEIELGIYGHDEGLTESEYKHYLKNNSIFKTTLNSEGKKELLGNYIY